MINPRPSWPKPPAPPGPPPAPRHCGAVGFFVGEWPRQPKAEPQRVWNCMCDGCGAPLQLVDVQCTYCLRATGVEPPQLIDVTTINDAAPRVESGVLTVNEARMRVGLTTFVQQRPEPAQSNTLLAIAKDAVVMVVFVAVILGLLSQLIRIIGIAA